MIQVSIFVGVAVLLLLLLFSIGSGREIAEETNEELLERPRRRSAPEPGPAACARRVFSPQDRVFVEGLKEPHLHRLYRTERARVAEHWVHGTSVEIGRIMRRHRLAARQSHNLEVTREVKLLLQYVELRLVCGFLICMIRVFGAHAAGDVAAFAGQLSQTMGAALQSQATIAQATIAATTGSGGE
jgi:hypothetical protein